MSNFFSDIANISGNTGGVLARVGDTDIGDFFSDVISSKIKKNVPTPQNQKTVIQDKTDYTSPSTMGGGNSDLISAVIALLVLGGVFFAFRRKA